MNKRMWLVLPLLGVAGIAVGQGAILDMVANKVIGKYQNSTCEQLWAQKNEPKPPEAQKAIQFLKSDQAARMAFLNKVAGPISNKMFECGMIP